MRHTLTVVALCGAMAIGAASASASSISATEAYYTFGENVSSNTTRLLSDKATVIGFPGLETISFLLFDPADLPSTPLAPRNLRATLKLEHDPDALADTLIPASDARPVRASVYALGGTWDPVSGNLADIQYGPGGADAVSRTLIGDPGVYSWNVTELIDEWITGAQGLTALSLSGVFGNVNIDDRNSYATLHTVGSSTGLVPHLEIAPVPLPASFWLMLAALPLLSRRLRGRLSQA